jgi:hypothetical protein
LSSAVKSRSAESFPLPIKTLDAIHIASALAYREQRNESLIVFSYDRGFNRCAEALGFTVPFDVES